MIDFASPAAGMCVVARWASRSRVFSACFRMERRPSVLRRKLSMMGEREGYTATPVREREWMSRHAEMLKLNLSLSILVSATKLTLQCVRII